MARNWREGDAEKQVERRGTALDHPMANLIKIGRPGSFNVTTPELIASARPEFAIISVGFGNSFGLPRTEVLGRLADARARVDRTDLDGAVTSISMAALLRLHWRLFNSRNLRRYVLIRRRPATFRDHATGGVSVLFAYQQDHPT